MRILLLTHRLPYPPNKGDKIRTFNVLEHLARRHEVFLACPVDDPADLAYVPELERRCARVLTARIDGRSKAFSGLQALLTGTSITVRHFHDAGLQRRIDELLDSQEIDAIFCFSSAMAEYFFRSRHRTGKLGRALRLMDLIDVDSYKWRQYVERTRAPRSWIYSYEAGRLADYERRIASGFDHLFLVSAQEREYMPAGARLDHLQALSNGVDLAYFTPRARERSGPPTLVFTGVMDYWPNVQGVQWFADAVLPRIRAALPEVRFVIVGSKPTEAVVSLKQRPGIEVTGFVDDVRVYVADAALCVVPLKIARGLQNKVLEAMAMGKAVVCTSQALEGIRAGNGIEVVVADEEADFAAQVVSLLEQPERAAEIGRQARRCMERSYSWEANLRQLDTLLDSPLAPVGVNS
ncbi:MAG TPA: TIGR03087 family PEP-CTERM/XrtA system glycosyltransferase [Steroidobacteraceae bacterium]|nr:TIGR03087 family PEP-CTERM/XrtA system glycosyltransferase [Steroidobacteraceae bacterium]